MHARRFALLALATAALSGVARADTVLLTNGRRIQGEVTRTEAGLRIAVGGGTVTVPHHLVARVDEGEIEPAAPRVVPAVPEAPRPGPEAPAPRRGGALIAPTWRPGVMLPPVSDRGLESARERLAAARERAGRTLTGSVAAAATRDARSAASVVRVCYEQQRRDLADQLIEAHPELFSWDAPGQVEIECEFRGEALELKLTNPSPARTVALCIPPGTYGRVAGTAAGEEVVPSAQDLGLLESPVVVLHPRERRTVRVPVACASIDVCGPASGARYRLERFPAGSPIDRLLEVLCAGPSAPDDVVQLAVWVARNDFTRLPSGLESFRGAAIDERDLPNAVRLLIRSGVDPRETPLLRGCWPAPRATPHPARAPEPAPTRPAPPAPVPLEVPLEPPTSELPDPDLS